MSVIGHCSTGMDGLSMVIVNRLRKDNDNLRQKVKEYTELVNKRDMVMEVIKLDNELLKSKLRASRIEIESLQRQISGQQDNEKEIKRLNKALDEAATGEAKWTKRMDDMVNVMTYLEGYKKEAIKQSKEISSKIRTEGGKFDKDK